MVFSFKATVEIDDDDIDEMVKNVKERGMNITEGINMILREYGRYEYYCSDYYFDDLREEVERRLDNVYLQSRMA